MIHHKAIPRRLRSHDRSVYRHDDDDDDDDDTFVSFSLLFKDPVAFHEFFSRIAECLAIPDHLMRGVPTTTGANAMLRNRGGAGGRSGEVAKGSFYQDLFILEKKISKVDKQDQQLR